MRIIGGIYRGRKINPPSNLNIRPTTDLAKEALFNILNNHFDYEDISVLDLFSGTGSISYEFASRGVNEITAVDISYVSAAFIREMAAKLEINGLKVFRTNAFNFINKAPATYDIIFADPPYDLKGLENIAPMILKSEMLKKDGWLILEHPAEFSFLTTPGFYELRKYGKVHFSIFRQGSLT